MRIPVSLVAVTLPLISLVSAQEAPDESLGAGQEVLAAGATLFPIGQYSGDLFTREVVTGDWGGIRTSLAEDYGLQFLVDVNQFYQGVWDGGRSSNAEYSGSSDYVINFDSGQRMEVSGKELRDQGLPVTIDEKPGATIRTYAKMKRQTE